jgi:hypothetical protein
MEKSIKAFAEAAEQEAEALFIYRKKRGELLRQYLKDGIPVTTAGDIARGESATEKQAHVAASNRKREAMYWIEAYKERIFTIRHLCRGVEAQIKTQ